MAKIIAALIRHALGTIGGAGLITGDQTEQIAGAISVIISVIWSILEKKGKAV